jgi:replication-associated recombination protein RarA
MTGFVAATTAQEALGIPIRDWISFLQLHSENSDPDAVAAYLLQMLTAGTAARSEEDARRVLAHLSELVRLLTPGSAS